MADIQDLSVTDASNTGRWPENMAFSAVNDAGRADEGLLARWFNDVNSSVVASGAPNAYTATSNRTISSLVNNTIMVFTANFTNTGSATFNLNGLGAKTIKRFSGVNLAAGDITSGQPVGVIYKSSPDCWFMTNAAAALATAITTFADFSENASPGTPAADTARLYAADESGTTNLLFRDSAAVDSGLRNATQTEMETGTSVLRTVTPGRQHFHPGHPKAGGNLNGSGTPAFASGDYGMGAVTDNGTGDYTLALDTAFSSISYWITGCARSTTASAACVLSMISGGTKTTSSIQVGVHIPTQGNQDSTEVGVSFWGDYA
jgi:hypothetical protein